MSEAINIAVEKAEKPKKDKNFTFLYKDVFSVFSQYNGLDMH